MIGNILPIDIKMRLLIVLFFSQSNGKQERHFLRYEFTVLTKTDSFPAFSAVCESDDKLIAHYNNEEVWIRKNLTDWTEAPAEPPERRGWYQDRLSHLSNCTLQSAQCSDHVLQRIIGCELERFPNGTRKSLKSFNEYRFDGRKLSAFNSDMQWIDKDPKAKEKHNQFLKHFFKTCPEWILTFNNTIKSSPDVHVFARKCPGDRSKLNLTCLATGFYPRDIQMNIRRNRINLEDQTSSGIRPNTDETFQKRISVKIHRNHEGSYDCLITHSSLTAPVTAHWDGKCSNCEPEPQWDVAAIVVFVVAVIVLVILIVIVMVYLIYRRRSNGLMTSCSSYGSVDGL